MPEDSLSQSANIFGFDAYELAEHFLAEQNAAPLRPSDFGRYRFLQDEPIGSGSMADVWLAEEQAADRVVAVKFLRNTSEPDVWASRETKRLGSLEHKFIARLYVPGVLDDGTPWLAMEYVEGEPLDVYVRERRCSVQERLVLFLAICEAVQFAHAHRIVHGDLKPSNIRVTKHGEPKLLDFGLAEQLQSSGDRQTAASALLGLTPAYAAPEQFRGEPASVSIDIYALGAILYELLTGTLPFDASRRTYAEVLSTKINDRATEPPSAVAHAASVEVGESDWRELDAICLHCLASDQSRRYASVEALVRDLDRYLRCEPLEARLPHSRSYQLGKYVKRNRRIIAATLGAFLVIVALAAGFAVRLASERDKALAEAARTRQIQGFMLDLFGDADKQAGPSKEISASAMLDRGAANIALLNADPETQQELYETFGRMYETLNKFPQAEELLRLALDKARTLRNRDATTVRALVQFGLLRGDQGQTANAQRLIQQGLDLASRHLAPNDPAVLDARSALGRVLVQAGDNEKAIALLDPIVKNPPSGEGGTVTLIESLTALAVAQQYSGRYDVAKSLNQRALALDIARHGNNHPRVAVDLANLATTETTVGDFAEAEKHYREAVKIMRGWYGADNAETLQIQSFIATVLIKSGKTAEAEELLRNILPLQEKAYGTRVHPNLAFTHDVLGRLAAKRGDLVRAVAECRIALEMGNKVWGSQHYNTAMVATNLADLYAREHLYTQAEKIIRPALKVLTDQPRPGNASVGVAEVTLGVSLARQKRYREAEEPLTQAYKIFSKQPKSYGARLHDVRKELAELYGILKQDGKAAAFRAELAAPYVPGAK